MQRSYQEFLESRARGGTEEAPKTFSEEEIESFLLEENWKEVPAEVSDVIVFACKVANIAEKFHKVEKLNDVLQKKISYCETRKYNAKIKKFDKPKNKEFK